MEISAATLLRTISLGETLLTRGHQAHFVLTEVKPKHIWVQPEDGVQRRRLRYDQLNALNTHFSKIRTSNVQRDVIKVLALQGLKAASTQPYLYAVVAEFRDRSGLSSMDALSASLNDRVKRSLMLTNKQRAALIEDWPKKPKRVQTNISAFLRNPHIISAVLIRANGKCEICREPAPFLRTKDGTPYLEVHHRVRLADDGEDTEANAVAVCPNCHREAHYGV